MEDGPQGIPLIPPMKIKSCYMGTGVVIAEDKENYYILTAGHVAQKFESDIKVIFYEEAEEMVDAEVLFSKAPSIKELKTNHEDLAIIRIKKENLSRSLKPIPLGTHWGRNVFTIGCSNGEIPSIIYGKIFKYNNGEFNIDFSPGHGRSGSGVFNKNATKVLGLVTRTDGECFASQKILQILKKELPDVDFSSENAIIDIWSLIFTLQCFPSKIGV